MVWRHRPSEQKKGHSLRSCVILQGRVDFAVLLCPVGTFSNKSRSRLGAFCRVRPTGSCLGSVQDRKNLFQASKPTFLVVHSEKKRVSGTQRLRWGSAPAMQCQSLGSARGRKTTPKTPCYWNSVLMTTVSVLQKVLRFPEPRYSASKRLRCNTRV